jgi:hypothetical protein
MSDPRITRRSFLRGSALAAVGGAAGWWLGRRNPAPAKAGSDVVDTKYVYDVSEMMKVDPALLIGRHITDIPLDFQRVRRLLVLPDDRVLVAGEVSVKFAGGAALVTPGRPPLCLAFDRYLYVGLSDHVEVFDLTGQRRAQWPSLGDKAYLTSIAVTGDQIFLADAGNREIVRCDHAGKVVARFGKGDFVVPSPYFDIAIGPDDQLHVVNPGKHRIEIYTLDGQYRCAWGKPSFAVDGFCGCCNPVFLKILPDGRYLTSEKGLTRVKLHAADGKLLGVVAGPADLCSDVVLAEQAADDCRLGCGFDVAVNSRGEILILDPNQKRLRTYQVPA